MLTVLPVQQVVKPIPIVSAVLVVLFWLWVGWLVYRGLRTPMRVPDRRWLVFGFVGIVGSAIALLLILDYGLNSDITRAFRYSFVYFPAVILLLAVGLSPYWRFLKVSSLLPPPSSLLSLSFFKKKAIVLIWLVALMGALTVSFGFAYQKTHRPDLVVEQIQKVSTSPVLVTIAHQTHGQTGRLMGLAWLLRETNPSSSYYLDHQTCKPRKDQSCNLPTPQLRQTLNKIPRPFDLWLVNYQGITDLANERCFLIMI